MAAAVIPPVGDNGAGAGGAGGGGLPPKSHSLRRDAIIVLVATALSIMIAIFIHQRYLKPPEIDWKNIRNANVVEIVVTDSYWFHELYIRCTAVDWFLTFLATGTALSATIKNSVSVKSAAEADLSKWDLLLIVLALFAVLGTTFDGKIHAGLLADKYRAGDLILQEAKVDYAASDKGATAQEELKRRWHEAQTILETSVVVKPANQSPPLPPPGGNTSGISPDTKNQTKDQKPASNTGTPAPPANP
jgi:hypothetical protein